MRVLELFDDDKRGRPEAPFSIQNIVELGLEDHQRLPGEWYGVHTVNEILKKLSALHNTEVAICSFRDGEIVTQEVLEAAMGEVPEIQEENDEAACFKFEEIKDVNEDEDNFDFDVQRGKDDSMVRKTTTDTLRQAFKRPVLIMVSIQLGLNEIEPAYYPVLAAIFKMKHSIGAVGGRPRHSLYFTGIQYENEESGRLIYLDPHFVQQKVCNLEVEHTSDRWKFHSQYARMIEMKQLDPSLSFGFLL